MVRGSAVVCWARRQSSGATAIRRRNMTRLVLALFDDSLYLVVRAVRRVLVLLASFLSIFYPLYDASEYAH